MISDGEDEEGLVPPAAEWSCQTTCQATGRDGAQAEETRVSRAWWIPSDPPLSEQWMDPNLIYLAMRDRVLIYCNLSEFKSRKHKGIKEKWHV